MTFKPLNLPALMAKHHILPKKSLGQNFLSDVNILERIVQTAQIPSNGHVLEIGAGLGTLTRQLALAAEEVVAVEIDQRLIPALQESIDGFPNIRLVTGDILEMDAAELMGSKNYQVIANIPYYITSNLIRHLLEASHRPQSMALTIQYEVAKRICEKAGQMSLLALSVQLYGEPKLVMRIPAGAFFPAPRVDSAVLRVQLYPEPLIPQAHIEHFFRLAKAGFNQKRKKMRNALAEGMGITPTQAEDILVQSGIDPASRAQMLTFSEWKQLTEFWVERKN